MIEAFVFPYFILLSDGYYLIRRISDNMIRLQWEKMSAPQREEFEILYGKDKAFECFRGEIKTSSNTAAVFNGRELVGLLFSDYANVKGFGRVRALGCVCNTEWCEKHKVDFCKHCKELFEAFALFEPEDAEEMCVFITSKFKESRKWAVKFCGMKEHIDIVCNGESFKMYKRKLWEGNR